MDQLLGSPPLKGLDDIFDPEMKMKEKKSQKE